MDQARERAINDLRYGGANGQLLAGVGQARAYREPDLSEAEIAKIQEEHRAYMVRYNRGQALGHTLALGRRYDSVNEAIEDSKVLAAWLGLEIE